MSGILQIRCTCTCFVAYLILAIQLNLSEVQIQMYHSFNGFWMFATGSAYQYITFLHLKA